MWDVRKDNSKSIEKMICYLSCTIFLIWVTKCNAQNTSFHKHAQELSSIVNKFTTNFLTCAFLVQCSKCIEDNFTSQNVANDNKLVTKRFHLRKT